MSRGSRKPSAWVDKLPGDYKSDIPEHWYAHRLGLVDETGQPIAGVRHDAVEFFMREVVDIPTRDDPDFPGAAWVAYFRPHREYKMVEGTRRLVGRWTWTPPSRTKMREAKPGEPTNHDPTDLVHGSRMCRRHVFGHWWRGRMAWAMRHLDKTSPGTPELGEEGRLPIVGWAMSLHGMVLEHGDNPLLHRVLLGPRIRKPPGYHRPFVLPKADLWWLVARSTDGVRAIVVDLDCKQETDRPAFEARLRVLTSPGMPKPHLIVTSRGGGRHLWYLVDERAAIGGRRAVPKAHDFSGAFEERLEALGLLVEDGAIEVFPRSSRLTEKMPAIPFGDRSYLCDATGLEIVKHSPIDAITAWYEQMDRGKKLKRYSIDAFTSATVDGADPDDVKLASEHHGKRTAIRYDSDEDVPVAGKNQIDPYLGFVPKSKRYRAKSEAIAEAKRIPRPVSSSETLEQAREWYEDGAAPKTNYKRTPAVTRYIKFHLPRKLDRQDDEVPDAEDWRAIRRWLQPLAVDHTANELRHKEKSFERLFPMALPFSTLSKIVSLTWADLYHVLKTVPKVLPGTATQSRAGLTIVLAYVIGVARSNNPKGSGKVLTPVPTVRLMQVWRDGYRRYMDMLVEAGVIKLVAKATDEMIAEYEVRLPIRSSKAVNIASPIDLLRLMDRWIDDEDIAALFPQAKASSWKKEFKKKGQRGAID